MKIDVLLIDLVMILAVRADRQIRVEDDPTVFRSKEPGVCVPTRRIYPEPMKIDTAHSRRNTVKLRLPPTDRERNRCAEERIKIEGIPGVLPEIAHVHQHPVW